jgi:hypothetical protein
VRGVADAREENDRGAASAEIEVVQPHAAVDVDEAGRVMRGVAPTVGRYGTSLRTCRGPDSECADEELPDQETILIRVMSRTRRERSSSCS